MWVTPGASTTLICSSSGVATAAGAEGRGRTAGSLSSPIDAFPGTSNLRLGALIRPGPYLAPATGAVIGDDGLEESHQGTLVDDIALTNLDRSRGEVVMPLVDDALRVGRDGIVDEHIDVVLGPEQRTDVAVQREVGLPGPFDGLDDVRVGSVHQVSHLATDVLLPAWEGLDVLVDARIGLVGAHANDGIKTQVAESFRANGRASALGFTQYEPKPAGRRPDPHACSGSREHAPGRIPQENGFAVDPSLDMTASCRRHQPWAGAPRRRALLHY